MILLPMLLWVWGVAAPAKLNRVADSMNNILIAVQSEHLRALEDMRIRDSLTRVDLQRQLNAVIASDSVKRLKLQRELEGIDQRSRALLRGKKQRFDSLRTFVDGYPVVPFLNDTLFFIYNKLGSFSAFDRAEAISNRINKLSQEFLFSTDSLKLIPEDQAIDIAYGDVILTSVSEDDALWVNASMDSLASRYRLKIGGSIVQYRNATSWKTMAMKFGWAALIFAVLAILIFLVRKLFRWTETKIRGLKGSRINGIKIRNYELFDSNRQLKFFLFLNTIAKWIVTLASVYVAMLILFGIFPWTKGFSGRLLSYFLDPVARIFTGVWNYLPNLMTILVIVVVFHFVLKGLRFLKEEVEDGTLKLPRFYPDWASPTFQIIRILVYAFMLVVIFPYLPGSDSPIFRGVSVFLGLLFTFGTSGSLGNIIAGIVLTYMRTFKIGDRVKIGEEVGDVVQKNLLVTRIRTIKNEIISIPNSVVISSNTRNYSSDALEKGLILNTTVTIGYDAPWRQVHQLLIDAALATDMVEKEPGPFVLQTSLGDFYVSYQVNAYTHEPNKQAGIYSQLHQNIQDKFNEAGVEIMSPHFNQLRDGNTTTLPAAYLPKNYVAPNFKVQRADEGKPS